jgi:Rieske Fe-S protein
MDRLEFIKKAGALSALTYLGVSLESCTSEEGSIPTPTSDNPIEVDLTQAPFDALTDANGWVLHPSENILLVNAGSEIRAFSSVCPHASCARDWQYQPGVFTCTCHNSRFDTNGGYLSGPANSNLTELSVQRDGDVLTIG